MILQKRFPPLRAALPRIAGPRNLALLTALFLGGAAMAGPVVVTDIAPVHSLVSQVMAGVGEPELLVPQDASPHMLALKPSQARATSQADLERSGSDTVA